MKMKRTVTALLLCLVLCVALLSVSAFAEQTVVIIGGAIKNEASVVTQGTTGSQGTTVITGGTGSASTVISGTGSASAAQNNAASSSTGSVIVMPDGSVVTSRPAQTTQTVVTTTAGEAAQTQAAPSAAQNTLLNEIYNRINQERTANGLGILGYDTALQATADLRAKESASVFGHTRPDGSAAVTAVTVDYNVAGENLIQVTKEYATVGIIVETWLASESHKANIMLADFSQTALGIYESNGKIFISQIFTD